MHDKLGEAKAYGNMGNVMKMKDKFADALELTRKQLAIAKELDDKVHLFLLFRGLFSCVSSSFVCIFAILFIRSAHPTLPRHSSTPHFHLFDSLLPFINVILIQSFYIFLA